MNAVGETHRSQLEAQAREWLVRLNSGRAREEDRHGAAAWRAESPEHDAVYRDVEQVWSMLDRLGRTAEEANGRVVKPAALARTRARYRSAAIAAAVALATVSTWLLAPSGGVSALLADARTAPGERRTLNLEDGSRITLNGASAVNWSSTRDERRVELISGEAYFQVAKDAQRPFVVTSGPARIRVTGTAFVVEQLEGGTSLTVLEGQVMGRTVGQPDEALVTPGQVLQITQTHAERMRDVKAEEAKAWMRGRLVFRDASLQDIVNELSRYSARRIVSFGERARRVRITGVFESSDPDRVLEIIAHTEGLQLRTAGPLLAVLY